MSSKWGNNIQIEISGTSHGPCLEAVVEGLPSGEIVDMKELLLFMSRRTPGREFTSQRKERDIPHFLSGISDGLTDGSLMKIIIYNEDANSSDYVNLKNIPRPGHADYPVYIKTNGTEDMSGGGRFSGRLTAMMCAIGGIAKQILSRRGIEINAILETDPDTEENDSIGGLVSCEVTGLPVGLGDALFDGIDGSIASIIFGIPAVKGIEFGAGFKVTSMKGSENNDEFYIDEGKVRTRTNNAGGVLGGMTNGMPLTFNVAFKPTPSISKRQKSVDLSTMTEVDIEIKGRHDSCLAVRAVPVVEACAAIAILDAMPKGNQQNLRNEVDVIDRKIAYLVSQRFALTDEIGRIKKEKGLPVEDLKREFEVIDNVASYSSPGLEKEISKIYSDIFRLSKERQNLCSTDL